MCITPSILSQLHMSNMPWVYSSSSSTHSKSLQEARGQWTDWLHSMPVAAVQHVARQKTAQPTNSSTKYSEYWYITARSNNNTSHKGLLSATEQLVCCLQETEASSHQDLSNNTNNTGNGTPVVKVLKKQYIPEAVLEGTHWLGALIDLTHLGPILLAYPHISAKTVKRPHSVSFVELINNPPTNWNLSSLLSPLDWFYNPSQCFRNDAASLLAAAAPLQIFLFHYSTKDHKLKILTKTHN